MRCLLLVSLFLARDTLFASGFSARSPFVARSGAVGSSNVPPHSAVLSAIPPTMTEELASSSSTTLEHTSGDNPEDDDEEEGEEEGDVPRRRFHLRVASFARRLVTGSVARYAMPQAIADILKDATVSAVDLAVEEIMKGRGEKYATELMSLNATMEDNNNIEAILEEAFLPLEQSLADTEASLRKAWESLELAKGQARDTMQAIQIASMIQAQSTARAVAFAEEVVAEQNMALAEYYESQQQDNTTNGAEAVPEFTLEEFDFGHMAPPFLDGDSCLIPGEPIVRVEKAPDNSRRIFAGIDIMAGVDDAWELLTNYEQLADVVPNLLTNEVLELYDGGDEVSPPVVLHEDDDLALAEACKKATHQLKGAKLRQVGGAKVAGLRVSARTTLEVREWPDGIPEEFCHCVLTNKENGSETASPSLVRYKFPRPFAISQLPSHDITMQSVQNDDGEFRLYQGVWRMQPLPRCAPDGRDAMRLTYAVEVSPRAYLPVQLIERRMVNDLCTNLLALRDTLTAKSSSSL